MRRRATVIILALIAVACTSTAETKPSTTIRVTTTAAAATTTRDLAASTTTTLAVHPPSTEPSTIARWVWETTFVEVARRADDGVFDAFNDDELIEFHYSVCESLAAADDPQKWIITIVEGDTIDDAHRVALVLAALHVPPGCKTAEERTALNIAYDFLMGSSEA